MPSAPDMASSASSSEGDITRTTLGRVAASFVSSFYNKLHDAPNTLYKFYKSDSTLTRCNNSKLDIETLRGHEEIRKKLEELSFEDCHTTLYSVDFQRSIGSSVIVTVTGTLSVSGQPAKLFTETFVLAPQKPEGYYILNDLFCYLDHEADTVEAPARVEEQQVESEAPAPEVAAAVTPNAATKQTPEAKASAPEVPEAEAQKTETQAKPTQEAAEAPHQESAPAQPSSWANLVARGKPSAAPAPKPTPKQAPAPTPAVHSKPSEPPLSHPEQHRPVSSAASVYVSNLPPSAREQNLTQIFAKFGKLRGVEHVNTKQGYCFVQYESAADAQRAVHLCSEDPVMLDGQQLSVEERKQNRAGRGGRGRNQTTRGGNRRRGGRDDMRGRADENRGGRGRGRRY